MTFWSKSNTLKDWKSALLIQKYKKKVRSPKKLLLITKSNQLFWTWTNHVLPRFFCKKKYVMSEEKRVAATVLAMDGLMCAFSDGKNENNLQWSKQSKQQILVYPSASENVCIHNYAEYNETEGCIFISISIYNCVLQSFWYMRFTTMCDICMFGLKKKVHFTINSFDAHSTSFIEPNVYLISLHSFCTCRHHCYERLVKTIEIWVEKRNEKLEFLKTNTSYIDMAGMISPIQMIRFLHSCCFHPMHSRLYYSDSYQSVRRSLAIFVTILNIS